MAADFPEATGQPKRGRPRTRRRIASGSSPRCYGPQCNLPGNRDIVEVLPEELEVLKLVDLMGYEQEEAAVILGVSRRTAWRDLHEARRKVVDALVNGKGIQISGCLLQSQGRCPRLNDEICIKAGENTCPKKWDRKTIPVGNPDCEETL
jgi:hypothetical protein